MIFATLVNDDFEEFRRSFGNHYCFPEYGQTYVVRGENNRGGILLHGITNPFFLISSNPVLFEELHFDKQRFLISYEHDEGNEGTFRPSKVFGKN